MHPAPTGRRAKPAPDADCARRNASTPRPVLRVKPFLDLARYYSEAGQSRRDPPTKPPDLAAGMHRQNAQRGGPPKRIGAHGVPWSCVDCCRTKSTSEMLFIN